MAKERRFRQPGPPAEQQSRDEIIAALTERAERAEERAALAEGRLAQTLSRLNDRQWLTTRVIGLLSRERLLWVATAVAATYAFALFTPFDEQFAAWFYHKTFASASVAALYPGPVARRAWWQDQLRHQEHLLKPPSTSASSPAAASQNAQPATPGSAPATTNLVVTLPLKSPSPTADPSPLISRRNCHPGGNRLTDCSRAGIPSPTPPPL